MFSQVLLCFPMCLLSSKVKGHFLQVHTAGSTNICQLIRHGEHMWIKKMCKIILVFREQYQATGEKIKLSYNLCSRNTFFFLHECKGGTELEWQKSQLKENHFPKAKFRFLKNSAHASGITILNGIVLTWKLWIFRFHKIFFVSNQSQMNRVIQAPL